MVSGIKLRKWQEEGRAGLLQVWSACASSTNALVAACPGAGKTVFGIVMAQEAFERGTKVVLVVAPSVNVVDQWCDAFNGAGINATSKVTNGLLQDYMQSGYDITANGHWRVFCLTYQQIARDSSFWSAFSARTNAFVVYDEIHHAALPEDGNEDGKFGTAVKAIAEKATLHLALSGTPFTTNGNPLATCAYDVIQDEDIGQEVLRTKPIYAYSYGKAIRDRVCRPTEFICKDGSKNEVRRVIATGDIVTSSTNLRSASRSESLAGYIEPSGAFMRELVLDALGVLTAVKITDPRAAMLVVCRDKKHAKRVTRLIETLLPGDPAWRGFSVVQVDTDTEDAHKLVKRMSTDTTDIIVSVRMVSEGVDIKRLRVGLYATDYRTRMFFYQFVGRFVRWEDRLDDTQGARIIIPDHPDLRKYAKEIEDMVTDGLIAREGAGGDQIIRTTEFVSCETLAGDDTLVFRDLESNERHLAEDFYRLHPSLRGVLNESQAIRARKDELGSAVSEAPPRKQEHVKSIKELSDESDALVASVVKLEGYGNDQEMQRKYGIVNAEANRAAGISKKGEHCSPEQLLARNAYLTNRKLRSMAF